MAFDRHVVVDARLAQASGIGTYVRNVVPGLATLAPTWRFTLILDGSDAAEWATFPNATVVRTSVRIFTVREQIVLPALVPRDADLYWATHYNFPLLLRKPLLVTIHDLGHLRLPEYTKSVAKRSYAQFMFTMARKRAAGLLFDSQFTRNEFDTLVGASNGNSAVVHLGVNAAWFEVTQDHSPLDEPYFLYVGNIKPHKNLHTLLTAFEQVSKSMNVRLVLIGRSENFRTADPSIQARVASLPKVSMLGEVDGATVRRYVRHATSLVLPSIYEGFGFPPLEAMAAGCPAIVSRAGSLPEVCGDAAKYFDAKDAGELARAMLAMANDAGARKVLVALGRAHARRFDWNVTAAQTHRMLAKVMGAGA